MMCYSPTIEIGDDEITIYDSEGNEVVKWIEDEWREEPEIVPAIANAIKLAFTDEQELKRLLEVRK